MKNKNHYSNENYEAENCAKTKIEVQTNNKKTHYLFFGIVILVIGCLVLGVTGYIKSRVNVNGSELMGEEVTITDFIAATGRRLLY